MKSHIIEYFELFFEVKGVDLSDREAYLRTEEQWEASHGQPKYSSYPSFRVMKFRYTQFLLRKALANKKC